MLAVARILACVEKVPLYCVSCITTDFGVDHLEEMIEQMTFPWLLSNIKDNVNEEPLGRGEITCMIDHDGLKVCDSASESLKLCVYLGVRRMRWAVGKMCSDKFMCLCAECIMAVNADVHTNLCVFMCSVHHGCEC